MFFEHTQGYAIFIYIRKRVDTVRRFGARFVKNNQYILHPVPFYISPYTSTYTFVFNLIKPHSFRYSCARECKAFKGRDDTTIARSTRGSPEGCRKAKKSKYPTPARGFLQEDVVGCSETRRCIRCLRGSTQNRFKNAAAHRDRRTSNPPRCNGRCTRRKRTLQ